MRDGHQMITVKDRNDRTIFEGPIERKEQRDQLPTDIKEKVEGMLKSGMLPQPPVQPDRGPDDVRKPGDLPPGPHSEE
jgi:hypothetical protein